MFPGIAQGQTISWWQSWDRHSGLGTLPQASPVPLVSSAAPPTSASPSALADPALCPHAPGEQVRSLNEVMCPRPAQLQGASSQPNKGFIGFVKCASCGQGPPGTRQHHGGGKKKQTLKLKGISFPEPRLTPQIEKASLPAFLPALLPLPQLRSVVQPHWLGSQLIR